MKIYSDAVVSKTELDAVDAKQSEQIKQLRISVAILAFVDVMLVIAIGLLKLSVS